MKYNNWKIAEGDWVTSKKGFTQKDLTGITRIYQDIGIKDYIIKFKARVLRSEDPEHGEIKFLFSDAESGEKFRIDFMFKVGACRVVSGGWRFPVPLHMVEGKDYQIRVSLKSNLLSVQVDSMKLIQNFQIGKESNRVIGFGTYRASSTFTDFYIIPFQQKSCFIIMPFDQKRNFLYEFVIKPSLENHPNLNFDFVRADESLTIGKISEEISDFIKKSDVIIADITEKNPNVYYELGYSHACSKKALLLIEKIENQKLDIPFDIQDFRCHNYSFSKEGFEKIQKKISQVLNNIITL